jgi:hypothetical protein
LTFPFEVYDFTMKNETISTTVVINGSTVRSNCLDFTPFVGRRVRLSDQVVYSLRSWIPVAF